MSATVSVPLPAADPPDEPPVRPVRTTEPRTGLRVRPVPAAARPGRAPFAARPAYRRPPTLAERIVALRSADTGLTPDHLAAPAPAAADPARLARALAGALVEVALGARPVGQLARWLAPGVLVELRERASLSLAAPTLRHAPVVRRLVLCRLDQAVEVAAAVDDARRTRAVALRLEPHRTGWRATAVEIG